MTNQKALTRVKLQIVTLLLITLFLTALSPVGSNDITVDLECTNKSSNISSDVIDARAETAEDQNTNFQYYSRSINSDILSQTTQREVSDSEVMYAIIAPANFTELLIPLANWKTYKGVPAKIYTLNSIYTNYPTGYDDAEKIHMFLRNLKSQSSALQWVLLVGDSDVVPTRKLRAGAKLFSLDNEYASDYYYAGLSNDWDSDNDGVYGNGTSVSSPKFEGDWYPEVYVGRLPVGNETECNISVNDILTYEQNPLLGNWMKTAVLWGGLMNAPNVPQYDPNSWNAYKVKELMVKPVIQQHAWHMDIKTRYDYSQLPGNSYTWSNDKLTKSGALSDFNAGCSVLNFAGQAYYTGNAILHYDDPTGTKYINESGSYSVLFSGTDGETATNTKKLPLVVSITCGSGDFAEEVWEDLTLERLLVAPAGGAIGLIASTGRTYRGESASKSDGNWWMDREFFELFLNGTTQPGRALYEMKCNYVDNILSPIDYEKYKAQLFGYNYQGDPELHIWTDWPRDIDVNVSGLWLGPHNITAEVIDEFNKPVENARVCIQNQDIYVYGLTNSTGIAKIPANPTQLGPVEIVVTGHNFLPYNDTDNIDVEPPDLTLKKRDIEFSNENPMVNQQIKINATITNRGQTSLSSQISVRFSLDGLVGSGGIQIGSDQGVTNLGIGAKKTVSVSWDVIPGHHEIFVEIDPENEIFESNEWNNIASKTIYIRKPELYVISNDIEFDPAINVYEKTNIKVTAKVYNIGDAPALNVKVCFIEKGASVPDRFIGENKTLSVIKVNSYQLISTYWQAVGGEHEIVIELDPDNSLQEFNEENNTASKNITIKYPPMINPIPDVELNEDTTKKNAVVLQYYIIDKDTSIMELNITINSSETECSVIINQNYGIDVLPGADWHGQAKVTVTVSDDFITVNRSFNVTVKPIPDEPGFNETNYTLTAKEDLAFVYFVTAFDADGDTIKFYDDSELFDIDETTGKIGFTPTQDHVNNSPYNFNITLSDGDLTKTQLFELFVLDVPDAPIIKQVEDQYATEGSEFKLQIIVHDVDSDIFFFYDNTTFMPDIDLETGIIQFTPTGKSVGKHYIKITVSDDTHESDNMTFILYVNATDKTQNNGNGDGDNNLTDGDDKDKESTFFGEVGGVPVLAVIIILVIIIVVIIVIFMIILKKRREKQDHAQFFSPEYDDRHLGGGGKRKGTKKPEGYELDQSQERENLSYEEEYEKLYSSSAPTKKSSGVKPKGSKIKQKSLKK